LKSAGLKFSCEIAKIFAQGGSYTCPGFTEVSRAHLSRPHFRT